MSVRDTIRIVLFDDSGRLLHEMTEAGSTAQLLRVLDIAVGHIGCTAQDIGGIAVYVGVGTFTGTRIAVTIANTFAYARRLRVSTTTSAELSDLPDVATELSSAVPGQYISATYSGAPRIGTKS